MMRSAFSDDEDMIKWSEMDDDICLVYNTRVQSSQKPSMWEYSAKGGLPTELANLDSSSFLTSHLGQILCSFPVNVLIRICSMLSVRDFVDLSLTCRMLHWRMFTFCTCYTQHNVNVNIYDVWISDPKEKPSELFNMTYILKAPIEENDDTEELKIIRQCEGRRGLFIYQPFCLRKPFFFETLKLNLNLPYNCKTFYNKYLLYILTIRRLARHLNVVFFSNSSEMPLFNYSDTNNFLKAINATNYDNKCNYQPGDIQSNASDRNTRDIFMNCPYARQMNIVEVFDGDNRDRLNVPNFKNSVGIYWFPLDSAIIATLQDFLSGSTNLLFHQYMYIEQNDGRFPLIEYLFREFGEFVEIVCSGTDKYNHMWTKAIATKNGEQIRIMIGKCNKGHCAAVAIGKDDMIRDVFEDTDNTYYYMEMALEPDETEDKAEEEQEALAACLSLYDTYCSIQ